MKVAVCLSGCGFKDGSEIHESVLTLLSLNIRNVQYQCVAPNMQQHETINHFTGQKVHESRYVLLESARIARGDIIEINRAKAENYDAVIFPGGLGAGKNLSSFLRDGKNYSVNNDIRRFAEGFISNRKPLGFICLAPCLIPALFPNKAVKMTVGNDSQTINVLKSCGLDPVPCAVDDCVVDEKFKVVSTPAYMYDAEISEVFRGIDKLVEKIISFVK